MPRPNTLPIAGLTRLAPIGLGLLFGFWFVLTAPQHPEAPLWPVWMVLTIALTTAAGMVFAYGLNRWTELLGYCTVRLRDVIARPATILSVTLLVILAGILRGPVRGNWHGVALFTVVLLGAVPAVGVTEGIRHAANKAPPGTRGEQTAVLIRLRQLLQRLLAAAGAVVALWTLALGAGAALQRSLPADSGHSGVTQAPPEIVLVLGGVGSLLVALFYVPAATALQRSGQSLCDELFPLTKADEAPAILSVAEDRHKLEQLLGMNRSVFADLQTGLVILGPLLAGAAAAFLSPNA